MHNNIALSVLCKEPKGDRLRHVRPLEPLTEDVLAVYDKVQLCKSMFGRVTTTSIEKMLVDHWKFWLVDDVGLLCFDPFQPGKAHVHITFWDKRLRGREQLCRTTALWLMEKYNVDTVLTAIPEKARTIVAFALRVGFRPTEWVSDRRVYVACPAYFTVQYQGM